MDTGTVKDAADAADPLDQVKADAAAEVAEARAEANPDAAKDTTPRTPSGRKSRAKPGATKGGARPGAGRPAGGRNGAPTGQLDKRLAELFGMIGLATFAVNQADGAAIIEHSEPIAKALQQLAKENPAVARFLNGLLQSSAWGGVIMATAPLVLKLCANHGLLPAGPMAGLAAAMSAEGASDGAAGNGAGPRLVG